MKSKIVAILLASFLCVACFFLSIEFKSSKQSYHVSKKKLTSSTEQQLSLKVILIIIDAARYSYVKELPFIHENIGKDAERNMIWQCSVGMPTMTTQRIQSLMTGSQIFSTANIIDSFFSSQVDVDNIINQLKINNKKSVAIGDDTWGKLFNFDRQIGCKETFDIWDWDTCDDLIYQHLLQQIKQDNDFIVAHFLALDHIGHATSSLKDPSMNIKKMEISTFIQKVIDNMGQESVLLVTGDHGMREDGNHGGSTQQQTQTFLFMHSNTNQKLQVIKDNTNNNVVYQPDITATLSLLLDVGVPMNSVGIPIVRYPNNNEQTIKNTIRQHYKQIQQFSGLQCEPMPMNDLTLVSLQDYRDSCLSKLTHTYPNIQLIVTSVCLMAIILILIALIIPLSISQYIIIILISFPCYFSWFLIQHSSTYFTVCILLLILLQYSNNSIVLLALLMLVSQLQYSMVGQYHTSILNIHLLNLLWTHNITIIIINLLLILYIYNTYRNIRLLLYYMIIFIDTILKMMSSQYVYSLNIFIVILGCVLVIYYKWQLAQYRLRDGYVRYGQIQEQIKYVILGMLIIFLDTRAIYVIILTWLFLSRISHTTYEPYLMYLWSHLIWLTLGNRYEYSSIDIRRSYVFTSSYHHILNPICLTVYMLLPYLIPFIISKLQFTKPSGIVDDNGDDMFVYDLTKQRRTKWILILLCSMLSIYVNLVYNNEKILFTVVYVPMAIIESGKMLVLVGLLIMNMLL